MTLHFSYIGGVLAVLLGGCSLCLSACGAERPIAAFRLWTEDAPDALGKEDKDIPTLTPYWPAPEKATGAVVIVFPGGGYNVLAAHEGEPFAKWLNSQGIAAFVLKYRLYKGGYKLPSIFKDAQRAIRTVRTRAKEWQIDPARIGVIGSSAGGHLAAVLSTQFDAGKPGDADAIEQASSRPDFTILCYGFILFDKKTMTDPARREAALGSGASDEQGYFFAPARNVRADSPPCFVWQTVEDDKVTVDNALTFADALRVAKVPYDLHLYERGRHGIGLGTKETDPEKMHPWTRACVDWMKQRGVLNKQL